MRKVHDLIGKTGRGYKGRQAEGRVHDLRGEVTEGKVHDLKGEAGRVHDLRGKAGRGELSLIHISEPTRQS